MSGAVMLSTSLIVVAMPDIYLRPFPFPLLRISAASFSSRLALRSIEA
jgi:hypothetical protein